MKTPPSLLFAVPNVTTGPQGTVYRLAKTTTIGRRSTTGHESQATIQHFNVTGIH